VSTYIDSTVPKGAQYTYSVSACNRVGCSVAATVTIDYSVPASPSGLVGSASPSGISLDWEDVDGATSYKVSRLGLGGFATTTAAAVSSYSDSTVSVDNQYTYSVMACNKVGCSSAAAVVVDYAVPFIPIGGSLTSVFNVTDSGSLELDAAGSVTTAEVGGNTYLFAAGWVDKGVSVFRVNVDGSLTSTYDVTDSGNLQLRGARSLTTAEVGNSTYLFVAGTGDDGVSVFSVNADGSLTSVFDITDSGDLELDGVISVTTAVVGGTTYLFAAGHVDNGVSVFSVNADGSLTSAYDVTDTGSLELAAASSVTTAVVGGRTYLFTAGFRDDGVSVFSVNDDGSLTSVFDVTDGGNLELDGANSVTTAEVGGRTYLFATGYFDSGVSVFSVNAGGSLTSAYDVTDGGSLELDGAYSVTTTEVGGRTYLFVAGYLDNGVSVFSVNADGSLTSTYDVTDTGSLELDEASSVTTSEVGDSTYLFVAGTRDDGVSVFSVTPPFLITWSMDNAQVLLDWDDVAVAEYYAVRRDGRLLTSGATLTESSFVDSGLVLGRSYRYEVTACNPLGCSTAAAVVVDYVDGDGDGDGVLNSVDVDADGDGLIELRTAAQLNMMRNNLAGTGLDADNSDGNPTAGGNSKGCGNGSSITACNGYEQMANIDLTAAGYANWEPIGTCGSGFHCRAVEEGAQFFSGVFAGNDFTISNLLINLTTERNGIGFFGAISPGAQMHNVHIRGGNITAAAGFSSRYVGGLVGWGSRATISNSSVTLAAISGTSQYVGGLVGDGSRGTISSSVATVGSVSGVYITGGLVGFGSGTKISSSLATVGSVSGIEGVGGLVGQGAGAKISSSVATVGSVSGTNYVGGLFGQGSGSRVSSSVATVGSVSGAGNVGGLFGFSYDAIISSSVATVGSVSGTNYVGGLVGAGWLARISSSLAVTNSINGTSHVGGLVGSSGIIISGGKAISLDPSSVVTSYWYDRVSFVNATQLSSNRAGSAKSTAALQAPNTFTGANNIYTTWANAWCNPTTGEFITDSRSPLAIDANRVWDLGDTDEYPAINCVRGFFPLGVQREAARRALAGISPLVD
nr:hypothetical protein [Gammaproteobacteria bacterium]